MDQEMGGRSQAQPEPNRLIPRYPAPPSSTGLNKLLAALKPWHHQLAVTTLPKSPMGETVTHASNQWAKLNVYVTDGALAMDNNLAERAVKPYAIGRKIWLFFGSDDGGRRLAILSSFTATCQQFVVNPWTWLQQILTKPPMRPPAEQFATLLSTSNEQPG